MRETILMTDQMAVRLVMVFVVFGLMAAWEIAAPQRALRERKALRWRHNLALSVLDTSLVRITVPASVVGVATLVEDRGMGLLQSVHVPYPLAIVLSLLALDLAIYLQHLTFHVVPFFWRAHRVHHADLDFDVTTGVRFHPFEIGLSLAIKSAVIVALGPPAAAVLVFEVVLNATSMFNHGNVRIPSSVDRWLRWCVVTPDMHRVHHSIDPRETNSNFGFNLPWWDHLFGTYRAEPRAGHEAMTIGIEQFRSARELTLAAMLQQPFRDDDGIYRFAHRSRETASP